MKILFLVSLILLTLVTFASPRKAVDPEVQAFLSSQQYQNEIATFNSALSQKVDAEESFSFFVGDDQKVLLVTILFKENNIVTHVIRAIKVPVAKRSTVGGRYYLIALIEYTGFDFNTKSGTFGIYDLDNNGLKLGEYQVAGGQLSRIDGRHFCDRNNNGDVSFGECVTCMVDACGHDVECTTLCMIAELVAKQCWIAIRSACVWISIFN